MKFINVYGLLRYSPHESRLHFVSENVNHNNMPISIASLEDKKKKKYFTFLKNSGHTLGKITLPALKNSTSLLILLCHVGSNCQ